MSAGNETLPTREAALLVRFVEAFERYDVAALPSLCREDVTFSMPPFALWLRGRPSVAGWLTGRGAACRGSRVVPVAASGSVAYAQYKPADGGYHAWGLGVLELETDTVVRWTTFLDVETLFPRFGLDLTLPDGGSEENRLSPDESAQAEGSMPP